MTVADLIKQLQHFDRMATPVVYDSKSDKYVPILSVMNSPTDHYRVHLEGELE